MCYEYFAKLLTCIFCSNFPTCYSISQLFFLVIYIIIFNFVKNKKIML